MQLDVCANGQAALPELRAPSTVRRAGRALSRGAESGPSAIRYRAGGTNWSYGWSTPRRWQTAVQGLALGGFSVGEPPEHMHAALLQIASLDAAAPLPDGRGTPEDLLRAVGAGIDLFDCVMPTRNAETVRRSPGRASSHQERALPR